ncbi:MAG TPA: sigma-70 family RNA polymerase sigma factor [Myxococcota bacterium]|nr:sigma-70 family RNA polymerase sigma factor [Myxococcota bacterium]
MTAVAPADRAAELETLFRDQRRRLFGLAYRLTGSAEDAEDVVQEAFARAAAHAPALVRTQLGPWLARVATNLGIDALRRRRRRAYAGPWLPSPIDDDALEPAGALPSDAGDPEVRYGRAESATFAFLVALEALSPRQRAVLLARDVLGHSARATAELVGTSEGSVRVLHLRARRALEAYDAQRCLPTAELRERHREALQRFLDCALAGDAAGLEALLAESVRTVTDAAGEYTALATPLEGRARVARLYLVAAATRRESGALTELRMLNGLPAALITLARPVRRQGPRTVLRVELDEAGRIRLVHAILAPRKLSALRTPGVVA